VPSTRINYSIPKTNFVTLKVYAMFGNGIKILINEEKLTVVAKLISMEVIPTSRDKFFQVVFTLTKRKLGILPRNLSFYIKNYGGQVLMK